MKKIFLSTLLGVGLLVAIFQSSSASNAAPLPEDYPLVCRGGGSLVIGIAPGERNIGFTFTRGTKPAGEGLAPGECSWADRGMHPNEPDRVSQHVEAGSESLKEEGRLAPENRWYEELHSADKYWTFMVSNNGRGQLIATSARPNPGVDVSLTARLPMLTPQPAASPRPRMNVPTPGDETPKMIVLNGPAEPGSRKKLLEGLTVGRNVNISPAPRAFSMEEKMGLLKSAGLEALNETPTPYVTLTPQQPNVDGRGALVFSFPDVVYANDSNHAMWLNSPDYTTGRLIIVLYFDTKGIYLMTSTVRVVTHDARDDVLEFVLTPEPEGTVLKFLGKKTDEWQHLNMIVEVAKPGEYDFLLEAKGKGLWSFSSCDVTTWKK